MVGFHKRTVWLLMVKQRMPSQEQISTTLLRTLGHDSSVCLTVEDDMLLLRTDGIM
jgi:hypothetical protein